MIMALGHRDLIARGLQMAGTSLRYPFDPKLPVLFVGKRMFALFGRTGEQESVNLKANPEEAWLLRQQYPGTVIPGYHMNKKHWNTVVLNGTVPDEEVCAMLTQSYGLVKARMSRNERAAIDGS